MGYASVYIFRIGGHPGGFSEEVRGEDAFGVRKLRYPCPEGVQFPYGGGHGSHGGVSEFRGCGDGNAVALVTSGFRASQGRKSYVSVGNAGVPEIPP